MEMVSDPLDVAGTTEYRIPLGLGCCAREHKRQMLSWYYEPDEMVRVMWVA